MNTETTEYVRGWVFYDSHCGFCSSWANRTHDLLLRRGFHLVPLQAPWVKARLGLDDAELMKEMKLLTASGRVLGGADALIHISGAIWWAWPVFALSLLPGVRPIFRFAYRRVAQNRYCLPGSCPVPPPPASQTHHRASSFYEFP